MELSVKTPTLDSASVVPWPHTREKNNGVVLSYTACTHLKYIYGVCYAVYRKFTHLQQSASITTLSLPG